MKRIAIIFLLLLQTSFAQQWSMGFWTAWGPNHPITDLDWGALTHVIQVGVEPQSNGSLVFSDTSFNANATALVAAAHANNRKILLNVWSGSGSDFNGAISNNLSTLVNNIMNVVNSYCGKIAVSSASCRDMMPDPAFYAQCLQHSFDQLHAAAG